MGSARIVLDIADPEDGERLDRLIAGRVPEVSRSLAQTLVKTGGVSVNGALARPATRVKAGDQVEVTLPSVVPSVELAADRIPLTILYEDDDLIIFDKPAGLVTHPAPGHERGTLVNAVRALRPNLPLMSSARPGIIHRLDKDTSGLIVVAKHEVSRRHLLSQWQNREVVKRYTALVHGQVSEQEATIDAPISRDPNNRKRMWVVAGGRPAVSHFSVQERFVGAAMLSVIIETGRTHQIRVHLAYVGHPVVGDQTYGRRPFRYPLARQFLHASYLKFMLPSGRSIELETPLPDDLASVLDQLRSESGERVG